MDILDLSKKFNESNLSQILQYLCCSSRELIFYKDLYFSNRNAFTAFIKFVQTRSYKERKLFSEFILDYWALLSNSQKDMVITNHNGYFFKIDILYHSIQYDNITLFNKIIPRARDPRHLLKHFNKIIIKWINRYLSFNILLNSAYVREMINTCNDQIWEEQLFLKNLLLYLENQLGSHYITLPENIKYSKVIEFITSHPDEIFRLCGEDNTRDPNDWDIINIIQYFTNLTSSIHVPIDMQRGDITQIYKLFRNLFKAILNSNDLYYNFDVHLSLLRHNHFYMIYEYFNDPGFDDNFRDHLQNICRDKLSMGEPILRQLLYNKGVFYKLYTLYPETIVRSCKIHLTSLNCHEIEYLFSDVLSMKNRFVFYKKITKVKVMLNNIQKKRIYTKYVKPFQKKHKFNKLNF